MTQPETVNTNFVRRFTSFGYFHDVFNAVAKDCADSGYKHLLLMRDTAYRLEEGGVITGITTLQAHQTSLASIAVPREVKGVHRFFNLTLEACGRKESKFIESEGRRIRFFAFKKEEDRQVMFNQLANYWEFQVNPEILSNADIQPDGNIVSNATNNPHLRPKAKVA